MTRTILPIAGVALAALLLAGCIQSASPILSDAQPEFGPRLKLQLYGLRSGYARDPEQVNFTWNGALYANTGRGMRDVSAFSIHPFEAGDFIIQSVPTNRARHTEYAVAQKLTDGVWKVTAIDMSDADAATRADYCKTGEKSVCTISTREQLFAFARATAARKKGDSGLAIRLPDDTERKGAPRGKRQR